jgi:hypothetical protein
MRALSLISAAVLISLGSAPAWAQTPAPNTANTGAPATVPKPAKDPEEIVCIRQAEIGSRIPGPKECHTRRVWDQMSQDARDNAQDLQNRSGTLAQQKGG